MMLWKSLCFLVVLVVIQGGAAQSEKLKGASKPKPDDINESPANETESPTPTTQKTETKPLVTQKPVPTLPPTEKTPTEVSAPKDDDNATDADIEISWFPFDLDPLHPPGPSNDTVIGEGSYRYYNYTLYSSEAAKNMWKVLSEENSTVHHTLSNSHMTAATQKLTFKFPFYGHKLDEMTIATGGFLSTGNDRENTMLATAQYIAPLMANFDTQLNESSTILYHDNGEEFIVEWRSVYLKDSKTDTPFTFQAQLHKSGDIVFIYKDVPLAIDSIADNTHPVKVGLSDAFTIRRNLPLKNQKFVDFHKVFIEYDRVDSGKLSISNWTAVYYTALDVCLNQKTCEDCTDGIQGFSCRWCPALNRCSDGTDRYRDEWIKNRCQHDSVSNMTQCSAVTEANTSSTGTDEPKSSTDSSADNGVDAPQSQTADAKERSVSSSAITTVLVIMCFVIILVGWVLYAYFHPHTASGQLLIKYRPSRFRWRRGEPSYTAAAIHM